MKSLKNGFLAIALLAGVSGAFATKIHAAPKLVDPVYDWTPVSGSAFTGTLTQAQAHYSCTGTATLCASGVINPDSPVQTPSTAQIRKN